MMINPKWLYERRRGVRQTTLFNVLNPVVRVAFVASPIVVFASCHAHDQMFLHSGSNFVLAVASG